MNNIIKNLTRWTLITLFLISSSAVLYAGGTISLVTENAITYGSVKPKSIHQVGDNIGTDFTATIMYGDEEIDVAIFTAVIKKDGDNVYSVPTGKLNGGVKAYDNLPAGQTVTLYMIVHDRGYIDHPSSGDYYYAISPEFTYTTGDSTNPMKVPDPKMIFPAFTVEYVPTHEVITPEITWSNPAPIDYGTPLSTAQLNATANMNGTFTYTPPVGTILDAGTQVLSAVFTPSDQSQRSISSSVLLVVNKATPTVTWTTPAAIPYGTILSETQLNATANVPGTFSYNPSAGARPTVGTVKLTTVFNPDDVVNYNTVTKDVSLTVTKATPVITWATPAAITTDTALSSAQLNAKANTLGSFVYDPPAGTKLSEGTHTLKVTFTPMSTLYYEKAVQTVQLVVTASKTPVVTWATPAAITYGTPLSETQLNATANVPGAFVYDPAAGTKLDAGTYTLKTTFTPADTSYAPITKSVQLKVNKATPVITWATPSSVKEGTELTDTQLNATANVEGTFEYDPAAGTKLNAGTQTLSTTFTPTDTANYNTAKKSVKIKVTKDVEPIVPVITWATPEAITYGTELTEIQLNATANVEGTFVYDPETGTKLDAGTHTLSVTFTPNDLTAYTTAQKSVQLVVDKATPVITWENPASVKEGTELTEIQLNATTDVDGTFEYDPAIGTKLSAGTQTLSATFTPTDIANYNTAEKSVQIVVTKDIEPIVPVITWATPEAITYGMALSETQLNATANVPGTFVYDPAVGTKLDAGTHTLSVTFTPNDLTAYTPAQESVQLVVNKAVPTVSWATPAAITYGEELSDSQLNAKADVEGTFEYSPAVGSKPNAGAQTLSATFTPTDSSNYTTVTKTVQLIVYKAAPIITWETPAPVTYGTVLSDEQLNATADVEGKMMYNPNSGAKLKAGTQTLSVTFRPTDSSNYSTAFASVELVVNKVAPVITWETPAAITYGTELSDAQLNATADIEGTFEYNPAVGAKLNAGTQTLTVTFTPADANNYETASASVELLVSKAAPVITWETPAAITYGTELSDAQLNATADIEGTFEYNPAVGAKLNAGTQTLTVTFTPVDADNYETASASVELLVNKAAPVITWTAPEAITYGTELSDAQLNATADVEGTFEYNPAIGAKLNAGTQTLTVTFTPADADNYETASASVELFVNKAAPVITWTAPEAITYGTELSDAQLNATADMEGTFEYNPAAGAKLNAGTQTLTATFTPADADNYETASASVELVVSKAAPVITWTAPEAITYGTELSDAQLNATADVEGTFEYNPAVGAKLNAGTQTLTVTFTPADADNYDTASASVELVVSKAAPVITWTAPDEITYGTELSDAQLNATADVEGTFEYNPVVGAKLNAGTQTLTVTFTPADADNYDTASASVELLVNKATQTIEFAPLADVKEGDDPFELSATASSGLAVTFISSDPEVASVQGNLVTIGLAGTTTITAVQEGDDNYEAAEATQTLTVLPGSDFIYVVNEDGTLTITGYRGTETDLEIPSVINEMTVTIIGAEAFMGNTELRSVVVPETVVLIDSQAFAGCTGLTSFIIQVPALPATDTVTAAEVSLTQIGDYVFEGCSRLTEVILPETVGSIGEGAFTGCSALEEIVIPASVESISDYIFEGCSSLTEVILPETIESIGEGAFAGCTALEEITIPASVESIGDGAFSDCPELTTVDFMGKIPTLSEDTFGNSENVVIYYFPEYNDPEDLPDNVKEVSKDQPSLTYKWENGELTLTFPGKLYESEDTVTWTLVEDVEGNTYVVKPNKGKKFYRVGM